MFSCEIYKIFRNTFLHRTLPVAASGFNFGEEQIYIHMLVLKVLRPVLMKPLNLGSKQKIRKN